MDSSSQGSSSSRRRRQGIFWIGTLPHESFTPYPVPNTKWIRGQLEQGESGYLHWQVLVAFSRKRSLSQVTEVFGSNTHWELSRSEAAAEYVWKEATRVQGTQFEFGAKPIQRSNPDEWDRIWESAVQGDLMAIPASIRVQNYRTLRDIKADYSQPIGMERTCHVFWGPTGTGKSRRAWDEAGLDAYPKDPRTKFWCGYRDQRTVVIDEFRGGIDISHMLRWLDRYPVIVEIKGSSVILRAEILYITSNVDPRLWYPDLDPDTLEALLRRLNIVYFPINVFQN